VKQVLDPETPAAAFRIEPSAKNIMTLPGVSPVLNGFDENAVEAALRLKDKIDANVTVLSLDSKFFMDVIKKPLSVGADHLVLLEDEALGDLDSYATAYVLSEAIKKIGQFDIILCGRQASDWDGAQVPQGIAEMLGLPCITVAKKLELVQGRLVVHRVIPDGYEVVEASLPVLVTVTNELGDLRYATLKGIMAAGRIVPAIWGAADLELESAGLAPRIKVTSLSVPQAEPYCVFIEGGNNADAGRQLASKLRSDKLI